MHFGRRAVLAVFTLLLVSIVALPASAHGENDARALLRDTQVGPYSVTLWQVIGDYDSPLPPHLIVKFSDATPGMEEVVTVEVMEGSTLTATPSKDSPQIWETATSIVPGDELMVRIADGNSVWTSPAIVVAELAGSNIPMEPLLAIAVFFTTAAGYFIVQRTGRAIKSLKSSGADSKRVDIKWEEQWTT